MQARRGILFFALMVLVLAAVPGTALAQVNVYAEGAYTTTELHVYIYADITGSPLCSFGVSLNYDPNKLTIPPNKPPIKNEAVWYFGAPPPNQVPYMSPDFTTSGKIIYIGGKLATTSPAEGVGPLNRVLLGKAIFSRNGDTNFGITLGLGKTTPNFNNFVTTTGTPTDSVVSFAIPIIVKAGDADKNGSINALDSGIIRNIFFSSGAYSVFADCNLDGGINALDAGCVRDKFFSGQ